MSTTLYSIITNIDIEKLKHELEAGAFTVLDIIPGPQGVETRTVVILSGTLSAPQIVTAQAVIDNHLNSRDPTTLPITSNLNIANNLQVDGQQTILHTTTVDIQDNILDLNITATTPTAVLSGVRIKRSLAGGDSAAIMYDERVEPTHEWKCGIEPNLYAIITSNNISTYLSNVLRSSIASGTANRILFNDSVTGLVSESDNLKWTNSSLQLYLASGSNIYFNSLGKISSGGDTRRMQFTASSLDLVHETAVTLYNGSTAKLTVGVNTAVNSGNLSVTSGAISASSTITAGTGITATTGNITASAGTISASSTITAGTGITATTGNITATAGSLTSVAGGLTVATTILRTSGNNSVGIRDSLGTLTGGTGYGAALYLGGDGGATARGATGLIETSRSAGGNNPQISIGVVSDYMSGGSLNSNIQMDCIGDIIFNSGTTTNLLITPSLISTSRPVEIGNSLRVKNATYEYFRITSAGHLLYNYVSAPDGEPGGSGDQTGKEPWFSIRPEGVAPIVFRTRTGMPVRLGGDVQVNGGFSFSNGLYQNDTAPVEFNGNVDIHASLMVKKPDHTVDYFWIEPSTGHLYYNFPDGSPASAVWRIRDEGGSPLVFRTGLPVRLDGDVQISGGLTVTNGCYISNTLTVLKPNETEKATPTGGANGTIGDATISLQINAAASTDSPAGIKTWSIGIQTSSDGPPHFVVMYGGDVKANLDPEGHWHLGDAI